MLLIGGSLLSVIGGTLALAMNETGAAKLLVQDTIV